MVFGLMGLLKPTWASMFGAGEGAVGFVMTALIVATGVFMYWSGRWSDRFGARLVATLGSLTIAASLALTPYASSLQALYLLSFTLGAGISLVYIPAVSSSQRWLPAKRGLASGIVSMLYGASGFVMVFPFRHLLSTQGYSSSLATVAALTLALGVASAQLMEFPERVGYAGPSLSRASTGPSATLREALRSKALWLTWLTWALCGGAGIGMVMFSTSISMELGLDASAAAACLAAFNLTNGLSRVASGALSDRLGRSRVMAGSYAAGAVGFLLLAARLSGLWAVILANLLAGLSFGTLFAVSAPYLMDHFGSARFGSIFGFTFTAYGFMGSWLGPFVGGLLRDSTGAFTSTCLAFAAYTLASAVAILAAGEARRGRAG